ncbi:TRAP transporter substrate-binding protein [Faunimonas sp. B44]|uniref:TRAP transporter substrate-binding protein n=1 Tax=Faunimonas sp. B44 TaxID=3461493 RepID=UPI004043E364
MNKTVRRDFLKLGAAALAFTLSTAAVYAQETYNWRIQTLWQPGTANQAAFERFAQNVKAKTDGQINITPLPAGAVVGVNETLDAVVHGILDGHHPATVYWTGRNPAFAAIGDLNAAYENPRQGMEWFYEHGGLELLREAYEPLGIYPIGVAYWGVESLPTTRKVASVDDLNGLKIRLPQGMASDLFAKFGAVPVNLPGSEVFSAMDNGTIDATDWGTLGMNAELGFHDKAKFAVYPGVHSMPAGDVSIKLAVWNSLDPRLQETLTEAVREFSFDMIDTLEAQNAEVAQKLSAEGVELVDWSDQDRRKFRAAAVETWDAYAAKNDLTRRAVESQKEYLKSVGLLD